MEFWDDKVISEGLSNDYNIILNAPETEERKKLNVLLRCTFCTLHGLMRPGDPERNEIMKHHCGLGHPSPGFEPATYWSLGHASSLRKGEWSVLTFSINTRHLEERNVLSNTLISFGYNGIRQTWLKGCSKRMFYLNIYLVYLVQTYKGLLNTL